MALPPRGDGFSAAAELRPGMSDDLDREDMRAAFLAGFRTARTGGWLGDVKPTSERAADATFDRWYEREFGGERAP